MNKDKLKEQLAEYRFWRGAILAAIVGLVGWFVTNYKTTDNAFLYVSIGAFIVSLVALIAVSVGINSKINEL